VARRREAYDDDSLDLGDGLDPEGPSADDLDRFGAEFKPCPSCRSDVYDQAEFCHVCGHVFGGEDERTGPPAWAIGVAVLVLIAFVLIFAL